MKTCRELILTDRSFIINSGKACEHINLQQRQHKERDTEQVPSCSVQGELISNWGAT